MTEFVDIRRVETELELSGASNLHNARMDYIGHKGFRAGMDYTFYKNDDKQHLVNDFEKRKSRQSQLCLPSRYNVLIFI